MQIASAMRLVQFIRDNTERVLDAWASHMPDGELRDEARAALGVIARRLETPADAAPAIELPLRDAIAVLSALRVAVIRLQDETIERDALLAFDEAVDAALATSIAWHAREHERRALLPDGMPWQKASHDELTGAPNRHLFLDRLEQDILRARRARSPLAVLYVDLDGFTQANERLGLESGNLLLREVAQRIASCIRATDTVARMGSDEFAVILNGVGDATHIEAIARAVLARLGRPFAIDEIPASIRASIGIAVFPDNGESVHRLVACADRAMHTAKHLGGDAFHFHSPDDRPLRAVTPGSARNEAQY